MLNNIIENLKKKWNLDSIEIKNISKYPIISSIFVNNIEIGVIKWREVSYHMSAFLYCCKMSWACINIDEGIKAILNEYDKFLEDTIMINNLKEF